MYKHITDNHTFASDVHTIAVIKAPESYENVEEGFRDVIAIINNYIRNPRITICGEEYDMKFTMCSDYKVGCIAHVHMYKYACT